MSAMPKNELSVDLFKISLTISPEQSELFMNPNVSL